MPLNESFEIDFLAVETKKSGDAITMQYNNGSNDYIHVVDGGFTDTGEKILGHIEKHYTSQAYIDSVVVTHSDADHVLGLKYVLEHGDVRALWMNRPWIYADRLIDRFANYVSVKALHDELRRNYDYIAELEDIAIRKQIPIFAPFQGEYIGKFHVCAPTKDRYFDLIVSSDRTPTAVVESVSAWDRIMASVFSTYKAAASMVSATWSEEHFPTDKTNRENEMSVIQYAKFDDVTVLLTGDAGREGLQEFIDYANVVGIPLPGVQRFQIPHHGSRRNVSTEILDAILGERLPEWQADGSKFTAICSSALEDQHHPKKAVERAMHHRGGTVHATEGNDICTRHNVAARAGWNAVASRPYPREQEE